MGVPKKYFNYKYVRRIFWLKQIIFTCSEWGVYFFQNNIRNKKLVKVKLDKEMRFIIYDTKYNDQAVLDRHEAQVNILGIS